MIRYRQAFNVFHSIKYVAGLLSLVHAIVRTIAKKQKPYCYVLLKLWILFIAVLYGPGIDDQHCILESIEGNVTLQPISEECFINGNKVKKVTKLSQGSCAAVLDFVIV